MHRLNGMRIPSSSQQLPPLFRAQWKYAHFSGRLCSAFLPWAKHEDVTSHLSGWKIGNCAHTQHSHLIICFLFVFSQFLSGSRNRNVFVRRRVFQCLRNFASVYWSPDCSANAHCFHSSHCCFIVRWCLDAQGRNMFQKVNVLSSGRLKVN